jgi:hypothetical protein
MTAACREFGEKFRVPRMPESGTVQHTFRDGIGDDGTGPPGSDVGDGLTNGGYRGFRAGVIGPAWFRRRVVSGRYDRQGIGKHSSGIFGANVGSPDIDTESSCSALQGGTIA